MKLKYNKRWKILIDNDKNRVQPREVADISSNSIAKLGKNEPVRMDVPMKIATARDCKIEDLFGTLLVDD